MRIDVFHHYPDGDVSCERDRVIARLDALEEKVKRIMRTVEEFRQAIRDIDVETTRIATKIEELTQKIKDGGLQAAEEEVVFSEIGALTERLRLVGKDPENPVPA